MMTIRKKADEIDAFKFDYKKAKELISPYIQCATIFNILFPYIEQDDKFCMNTVDGICEVDDGDIIMIGVDGFRYPCKPRTFKKEYDILK